MPEIEAPIAGQNWLKEVPSLRAQPSERPFEVLLASLSVDAEVAASASVVRSENNTVQLVAKRSNFSQRYFPPSIRALQLGQGKPVELEEPRGYHPPHLDLRPFPKELEPALRQPNRARPLNFHPGKDRGLATGIFPADGRRIFSDVSYPYSACGYVRTAAGAGSGVMVGPRHMLTASHVVNWNAPTQVGALTFTPLLFDTSEPFGHAESVTVYRFKSADPSDGIDADETAFDYALCVLNRRIGEVTGWLGTRAYKSAWNGPAYWAHVGYPSDLASGFRPAFIGPEAMVSTFERTVGSRHSFGIKHKVDVMSGQSGGPFYGWWRGESSPSVVSIQSAELWNASPSDPLGMNTCGGGAPLVELVQTALRENP